MMKNKQKTKVKNIATNVCKESKNFYLASCVMACERMIKDGFNKLLDEKRKLIKNKKEIAWDRKDYKEFESLCWQECRLVNRDAIRIYVDYIKGTSPGTGMGRTIYHSHYFIINLPESLLTGEPNKLKKMMAHELGHVVLHYEDLFINAGHLLGSKIFNNEKENEAIEFANELLACCA